MSSTRNCETCKRPLEHGDVRARDPRSGRLVCSTCLGHPVEQPNKIDVTATKGTSMDRTATLDDGDVVYITALARTGDYSDPSVNQVESYEVQQAIEDEFDGRSFYARSGGTFSLSVESVTIGEESSRLASRTASRRRVIAHDGGDGQVIRHCFSCGSGGVVGRSDGSCECTVCQTVFTVQVQPMHVNAPQTVNGQPVHIPGMPEESAVAPSTAVPAGDPAAALEEAAGPGPTISDDEMPEEFVTATGARVSREHYAQYLALGAPGVDRDKVLARVRTANLKR